MNEQIKELAEQAKEYARGFNYQHEVFEKKFAELIVRECVNNLEIHSTCFDGDVGRGVKIAARLTKEHFGVEE